MESLIQNDNMIRLSIPDIHNSQFTEAKATVNKSDLYLGSLFVHEITGSLDAGKYLIDLIIKYASQHDYNAIIFRYLPESLDQYVVLLGGEGINGTELNYTNERYVRYNL
jgi:hypothetical protein